MVRLVAVPEHLVEMCATSAIVVQQVAREGNGKRKVVAVVVVVSSRRGGVSTCWVGSSGRSSRQTERD